jgi:glycosyltransferase involved in cell wall biosynthesis
VSWLKNLVRRFAISSWMRRFYQVEKAQLGQSDAPLRILVVANALIPTVHLSILAPLASRIREGQCYVSILTEQDMARKFGKDLRSEEAEKWVRQQCVAARPTHIIFCRYSGPHSETILQFTIANGVPSLYIIDDDLLNVPKELGQKKYEYHNHPLRLGTVASLLRKVDLVYCSNDRLRTYLETQGVIGHLYAADIFCAGQVINRAEFRPVEVIGYMGFDHAHDFEIVLPALVKVMSEYAYLRFELFGKIPKPPILDQFGDRVSVLPVVPDYESFLTQLAARRWDIGICPLAKTDFNRVKNINKWIEYTSVGTAAIASQGMIYDECCSEGRGILAEDNEWSDALTSLINNPRKRYEQVVAAQKLLESRYNLSDLSKQIISYLELASSSHQRRP